MIRVTTEADGVREYPDGTRVNFHDGALSVYDDEGAFDSTFAEGHWRSVERLPDRDLEIAGETLSRVRLALTALSLMDELTHGAIPQVTEATAILAATCQFLVDAGAVDPTEGD